MGRWLAVAVLMLISSASDAAAQVTQADINLWVALWQKREGLEQWTIDARIVHKSEMPANTDGDVLYWASSHTANIRVLCATDMEAIYHLPPASARRESELVVVHELMHVLLGSLNTGQALSPAERDSVESVTESFAEMLLERRVPGSFTEAQFIDGQIRRLPFVSSPAAKQLVMLKLVRAMDAVSEDDVIGLVQREGSGSLWRR